MTRRDARRRWDQCVKHKADKRKQRLDADTGTDGDTDACGPNKRVNCKHKADKRKQGASDTNTDTDTDTGSDTDTARHAKRANCKHKADKRKHDLGTDTDDTDADNDNDTKRTCRKKKADKRKRCELRGAASGNKSANTRTIDKRKHEGGSQQGTSHPTARQLRAQIREQSKDCISDLEPN